MSEQTERMNLTEFNERFDLTRSGRAVEKCVSSSAHLPVRKTADGEIFEAEKNYFFFDLEAVRLRESKGLVPVGEFLTGGGLKVVSIDRLRGSKDDALTDAQNLLRDRVKNFSELIADLEKQKKS